MSTTTRFTMLVAVVTLVASCRDQRAVTSPPRPHGISTDFSDGRSLGGNPNFFFLPPIVALPTFSGILNPSLAPVVEVCQLVVDASGNPLACDPAVALINLGEVPLDPTGDHYQVNWDTGQPQIDLTKLYRIRVRGGTGMPILGFADIQPVSNGAGLKDVNTGQYIGLVDGRTLPVKFRIENGALCFAQTDCVEQIVGPAGGSVVAPDKLAAAFFPTGYLAQNTTVTISQVVEEACFGASTPVPSFNAFGCFDFATSPRADDPLHCTAQPGDSVNTTDATTCARVEVCPVSLVPGNADYHDLRLLKSDPGVPATVLKEATATLITNCPGVLGMGGQRVTDLARGRWQGVMSALGRLVMPKPLFAANAMTHLGVGGSTCCFSQIGWAPAALRVRFDVGNTPPPTLTIEGAAATVFDSIINVTDAAIGGVSVQSFIVQTAAQTGSAPASRAGATADISTNVSCGGNPSGTLPAGACFFGRGITASNSNAGTGTLVPGSATARFELHQGATLIDVFSIPVVLVAAPPPPA